MKGPLRGVTVVDLADRSAALAGRVLADLGADVILVEPPDGASSRRVGPFIDDEPGPDRSLFHWSYNRGKRSISLDLTTDDGRTRLLELAGGADVLIESAGPGVMAANGLGPDALARRNPAFGRADLSRGPNPPAAARSGRSGAP